MSQLSNSEKLTLISNLGTMISAGIPILEAVESLIEEQNGKENKILQTLRDDLNQGKTISQSFSKFPKTFDPVIINLIKAAEEAGTLDTTLKDLSVSIKKDLEFSNKIKSALAYPILIVITFLSVMVLILTFVIPRIASVFSKLKVDLPLPTKILIITSNFFITYLYFIIVFFIVFLIASFILYRIHKRIFINFLLSLPYLSILGREIDLMNFSRSMFLLLSSGIPIVTALDLSKNVVVKNEIKKSVQNSLDMVSTGKKLSEGLKQSKAIIPSLMIRIIEAGEKSGTLEGSMQELASYFDDKVSNTLKTLTTLIEPIMLIIIGVLIGGIMLTIIAPIYSLIGQLKAR